MRRASRAAAAACLALCLAVTGLVGAPAPAAGAVLLPAATEWDTRGDAVLSPAEALEALAALPPDSPAPVSWGEGGSRTGWFGEGWVDVDGDGCDTRNEVLARDLDDADYSRDPGRQGRGEGRGQGVFSCPDATVFSGTLHDPYTGASVAFTRGPQTSEAVQIDHVVPLNYLYAHGAWQWDERTRLLAANDPLNLLAVEGQANQDKGACGPATCPVGSTETRSWDPSGGQGWWPPQDGYRCEYASRFVSVASAYGLGVPEADAQALREVLTSCAEGGDGRTGPLARVQRTAGGVLEALTASPVLAGACALGLLLLGGGLLVSARRGLRRWGSGRRRRGGR